MHDDDIMIASQADERPATWTREYATELVAAWRASGQNLARWCREQGVIPHRLKYWSRRLDELAATDGLSDKSCSLVPIVVQPQAVPPVVVMLGDDLRLEVQPGCDVPLLRAVVEALR